MSACEATRQPSSRYIEFLSMYHSARPLKKGPGSPPSDAAGLLNGARYGGRNTPLKGKGLPPADDNETPAMTGGVRMVAGASFVPTDPLNTGRPIGADDFKFRSSIRNFRSAFDSSMSGSGAVVVEDVSTRAVLFGGEGAVSLGGDGVGREERRRCLCSPCCHAGLSLARLLFSTVYHHRRHRDGDRPSKPQVPYKRPLRRHGAEAPQDGVSHTMRRVQADGES
jgi:hypothetical protein